MIVLSGAIALGWRHRNVAILVVAVLMLFYFRWKALDTALNWHVLVAGLLSAGISSVLALLIFQQVFRSGPVGHQRILGAVAVYLLLALIWAELFRCLSAFDPAAFGGLGYKKDTPHLSGQLLYFSMTTLTTTGYGDIVPIHMAARSLANLESLVGQLFPAILIARLISLEVQNAPPSKP
jgi:voltage-gated potassium channel Kch